MKILEIFKSNSLLCFSIQQRQPSVATLKCREVFLSALIKSTKIESGTILIKLS